MALTELAKDAAGYTPERWMEAFKASDEKQGIRAQAYEDAFNACWPNWSEAEDADEEIEE